LLIWLSDDRDLVVMAAVDGLRRRPDADALENVVALQGHPSPYVRAAVLRYRTEHDPKGVFSALAEAVQDPNFIVREQAADGFDDLGNPAAVPHLLPLVEDRHPHVRQAAQTALENLGERADTEGPSE
jgi:HEAT repeat protein